MNEEFQKLLQKKNELIEVYFGPGKSHFAGEDFDSFCKQNFDTWIKNALKFREEFTYETSIFLAEFLKSDFTLRQMLYSYRFKEREIPSWDLSEKVDFIHNIFEYAYFFFGFLTFCEDYSKEKINKLFDKWYYPDVAKKSHNPKSAKQIWKYKGEITSGNNWVLINCSLFKFCGDNPILIKEIRNSNAHSKLEVIGEEIFLLDDLKTKEVSKEVDNLAKFLYDSMNIAVRFYGRLFLSHHFWLLPTVLYYHGKKLNYKKKNPTFDLLKKLNQKSFKEPILPSKPALSGMYETVSSIFNSIQSFFRIKLSNNNEDSDLPFNISLGTFIFFIEFTNYSLWNFIDNNSNLIMKLFIDSGFYFDCEKFQYSRKQSIADAKIHILNLNRLILSTILGEKETPVFEEYEKLYQNENVFDVLEILMNSIRRIEKLKLEEKDIYLLLFYAAIGAGGIILSPLKRLQEGLENAVIQEVN